MTSSVVVHTTEALTIVHNFIRSGYKITAEPHAPEEVRLTVDDADAERLNELMEKVQHHYRKVRDEYHRAA